MEQDKYISLGDTYIEIEGVETDVSQFEDHSLNGKNLYMYILSTKSLPETAVKTSIKF